MNSAIFLDRDGVIIENRPDYVRSWSDVSIYNQALKAIAILTSLPYKIILVTNQSAVGRGIISISNVNQINSALLQVITKNHGRMDDVFICPHKPDDACTCRKPAPGLILDAAARHSIDLSSSFMIGDAISDLMAAQSAGIPRKFLVRTGRGKDQEHLPAIHLIKEYTIVEDLLEAANIIASEF
jgi:D-glycero-D-manno-heptose 1,7-bisphosphate phosphatase